MRGSYRIAAAVWVLIALAPSAFTQPIVICVESSGRVSYDCNDVVPDELRVNPAGPVNFGFSSEDCGFCHDYAVGQTITQTLQHLGPAFPATVTHQFDERESSSSVQSPLLGIPFVDTSGSISPLKC